MYDKFVKHIYYPMMQKIKGIKDNEYLKILERSQWYSYEELKNFQFERLRKLLDLAYTNTPYYKKLFDQLNIKPQDIKTYEDYLKIPVLTKQTIRDNSDQMKNQNYKGAFQSSLTSGTTGKTLEVFQTPESEGWIIASQRRARKWFDIDIGDRSSMLWGRPLESEKAKIISEVKARFKNMLLISSFNLTDEMLAKYWEQIKRFKPTYFYSYASCASRLAMYVKSIGETYPHKCKAVYTTSDMLLRHQREALEQVFNCPVNQEFGSAETGAFGFSCEHKNVHISMENVLVEFINPETNKPCAHDEQGEIIVTPLYSEYLPLLRYNLGDLGTFLNIDCKCGRKLPIMDIKTSKSTDIIYTPDGRNFCSLFFDYVIWEILSRGAVGIKQFRVIQESKSSFKIQIVKDDPFNEECTKIFREKMVESFTDQIETNFVFVDEIPLDKSGKFRFFVPIGSEY